MQLEATPTFTLPSMLFNCEAHAKKKKILAWHQTASHATLALGSFSTGSNRI